jgi:hypothetical protein
MARLYINVKYKMKKYISLVVILFYCVTVNGQNKILKKYEKIDSTKISYDNITNNILLSYTNDTSKHSKIIVLIDNDFYNVNDKEFISLDKNRICSMEIYTNKNSRYNFEKLIKIKLKK